MSWKIACYSDSIDYSFNGDLQNTHSTGYLILVSESNYQSGSSEYKGPKDDVVTQIYTADSDHGSFFWNVTARRAGFNTYAEIEDISLTEAPDNCEALESPVFEIIELD